jgi:hypothetical protein
MTAPPTQCQTKALDISSAGRLTRPAGELILTMSANHAVQQDLLHFLDVLQEAA